MSVFFDSNKVDKRHSLWLQAIQNGVGLGPLQPEPYWCFKDLFLKASTKLLNAFHVEAESKRINQEEHFKITMIHILQGMDLDLFIKAIDNGVVLVDFDARTHHNHGTKFRLRQEFIPNLYRYVDKIVPLESK